MIQDAQTTNVSPTPFDRFSLPDESGRFGPYGGSFVPETLSHPLRELNDAYLDARKDPEFQSELDQMLRCFAGRPTELYGAERLSDRLGGERFTSSGKTCCIPEPTRSTMPSAKPCLPSEWARSDHCRDRSRTTWDRNCVGMRSFRF